MWGNYLLAEGLLSVGGFIAFYIWQMRSLKKAKADLEERERLEKEASAEK